MQGFNWRFICSAFSLIQQNWRSCWGILLFLLFPVFLSGCVSGYVQEEGFLATYQETTAEKGPQKRKGEEGLKALSPLPEASLPRLEIVSENGGKEVHLTIEDTILRVLMNNPELRVFSMNPTIAREDITRTEAQFDVTFFNKLSYEKGDNPEDSIFLGGKSESRSWEIGIKKKGITGLEWTLSYLHMRNVDNLTTRLFPKRYEPTISLQVKQPLLRDAWPGVNLADVRKSQLNYEIAYVSFKDKTEDILTKAITLYWNLVQVRRDLEIQKRLLASTMETLEKLENRQYIDVTVVQIKQVEASAKSRQASLFQAEKRLIDTRDALRRLLADYQINLVKDLDIVPATSPEIAAVKLDPYEILKTAMDNNPRIQQARLQVKIARIDMDKARRQKMPRLDLTASTRIQGLDSSSSRANDMLNDFAYNSYSFGVIFEYPLGNREKESEYQQKRLTYLQALANLQNVSDQVAADVRERISLAETAYREIEIQREAVEAARLHLQALKDTEMIREKMTPEFLLVKLQAQETLANAERAEIKAIIDFNIALVRLARVTGRVLELDYVKRALPAGLRSRFMMDLHGVGPR